MSGYNYQMGMSNNAVNAYCEGLVPASKIPGVPAALVRQYARPAEWHHTSKAYNRTDFYWPGDVRALFGLESNEDQAPDPRAVAALAAWKQSQGSVQIHEHCRVEWLEWDGSLRRPTCIECAAEDCRVEVKGQTATVALPDGRTFRKRLATRGFSFRVAA